MSIDTTPRGPVCPKCHLEIQRGQQVEFKDNQPQHAGDCP